MYICIRCREYVPRLQTQTVDPIWARAVSSSSRMPTQPSQRCVYAVCSAPSSPTMQFSPSVFISDCVKSVLCVCFYVLIWHLGTRAKRFLRIREQSRLWYNIDVCSSECLMENRRFGQNVLCSYSLKIHIYGSFFEVIESAMVMRVNCLCAM